jgi:hypothetical protein
MMIVAFMDVQTFWLFCIENICSDSRIFEDFHPPLGRKEVFLVADKPIQIMIIGVIAPVTVYVALA